MLVALNALAWVSYRAGGKLPLHRPLFELKARFTDLTAYAPKISHLERGAAPLAVGAPVYNYPAPAAFVYAFFLRGFPQHPMRAYVAVLAVALSCACFLVWRVSLFAGATNVPLMAAVAATALLGSPLVFAVDRGNLEGVVAVVLGIGLVLFGCRRYRGAAIFIGLAASIKPFPGFFLLLLLRRRLYAPLALGIAVAVVSVLAALAALGPTPRAAYRGLQPGVKTYFDLYVMKAPVPQEGRFDHSVMDAIKLLVNKASLRHAGDGSVSRDATFLPQDEYDYTPAGRIPWKATSLQLAHMHVVFIVSMALAAIGAIYTVLAVYRLPTINQMILIGSAITLFPPLAAEYTMIHLYVPFGFFLLFLVREAEAGSVPFGQKHVFGFLILFALLFSPMSFLGSKAGLAKTLVLIVLVWASGRYPMRSASDSPLTEPTRNQFPSPIAV